jgi:hypothetical protein
MITATGLELRAGARILLSPTTLRVQPGDRIGLVGRNGAGKTTTLKVLAGEGQPYAGVVERRSEVGYLPQDPRTGDLNVTARDRVLSARGLDAILAEMQKLEIELEESADDKLVRRYGQLEDQFSALAGTRPRPRPRASAPTSACPTAPWPRPSAPSPAASAAASSWPASCSPTRGRTARASCCSTSPPTTSTRTRSPGCAATWPSTRAASW